MVRDSSFHQQSQQRMSRQSMVQDPSYIQASPRGSRQGMDQYSSMRSNDSYGSSPRHMQRQHFGY